MPIMEIHDINIERYPAAVKVKGRYTKGAPSITAARAHLQPLDYMELGAETIEILEQGDNKRHYMKMYSYVEIRVNDIIVDVSTSKRYRVLKIWHYERAGLNVDHYKSFLVEEDA